LTLERAEQRVQATALLVGARTVRQGTGPFLAAALHDQGVVINGIVGTSAVTVAEAAAALKAKHGISASGYSDLAEAMGAEQPDIVVLCSPWQYHEAQLQLVAAGACHCLVEKPLLWPATPSAAAELIGQFETRGLLLQMVAQWPFALRQFEALYGPLPDQIDSFEMRLSPISLGPHMVPDAAPHFLSLLHALVGPGECREVSIAHSMQDRLTVQCRYEHARGSVESVLDLQTVAQRPRPAWIAINGQRAERQVQLPDYHQFLVGAGRQAALPDPLAEVAADFLGKLDGGAVTDGPLLNALHRNLCQLAKAWPE
jgi:predicted dehydrogenase